MRTTALKNPRLEGNKKFNMRRASNNHPHLRNGQEAFWTFIGALGSGLVLIGVCYVESRIKVKGMSRLNKEKGDDNIRYYAAKTACDMMKKAMSQTSEVNKLNEELAKVKDELATVQSTKQDDNASASEEIDLRPLSSEELFNRTPCGDNSKWIVDGYMKVGLVNLLVAGASIGKSNFMTQIALAVAKGEKLEFLPEECSPSVKLPVIYYRLEDFAGELEGKYGKGLVFAGSGIKWYMSRRFSQNNLTGFVEQLQRFASSLTEDTLICIDPATKLDGYNHSAFIKGVEEAMAIARSKGFVLTILASIHLDEIKDWNVLTLDSIKGGDQAIQKAGSVTAIRRERNGDDYRFLQCLKEPKGSDKPFNGDVLVCKKVQKELDENNKYLHYEFVTLKKEGKARPEKSKLQHDDTQGDSSQQPSYPPAQKITADVEAIIIEGLQKRWNYADIAKDIQKRTKKTLSPEYLGKYINKNNLKSTC